MAVRRRSFPGRRARGDDSDCVRVQCAELGGSGPRRPCGSVSVDHSDAEDSVARAEHGRAGRSRGIPFGADTTRELELHHGFGIREAVRPQVGRRCSTEGCRGVARCNRLSLQVQRYGRRGRMPGRYGFWPASTSERRGLLVEGQAVDRSARREPGAGLRGRRGRPDASVGKVLGPTCWEERLRHLGRGR